MNITWKSPSNIALIKYWGKHGEQLPNNPSLSLTLSDASTTTSISVSYTHLRAHETVLDLVCRLLLEKKNKTKQKKTQYSHV